MFTLHAESGSVVQPAALGVRRSAALGTHFHRIAAAVLFAWLCAAPAAHAQYFALGKGAYPLEFYDIDFTYLADPDKRTGLLDIRELAGKVITEAGGHGADVGVIQVDVNF